MRSYESNGKEYRYMTAIYNGREYGFRPCDTKGITEEELQKAVDERGHMQYEPRAVWLVVPGIGYGWEVEK